MSAVALDTERLTIRGHRALDLEDCAAMWGDPGVTRFIGGKPASREDVWRKVLIHAGHWSLLGFGYWVVREKSSGRFVGEVGFANFMRAVDPPLGDAPEAGWALSPSAHGRGFATEALRAATAWADTHFTSRRTVCMIDPANAPSLRVAEKIGYREYARTTYHGDPTILFERK